MTRKSALPTDLYRKYNLTEERFAGMLEAQGGGCAICKSPEPGGPHGRFCVDHDHACCPGQGSCGKCVRGILCTRCNSGLGFFRDNVAHMERAAVYLMEHSYRAVAGMLPESGACREQRGTRAGYGRHRHAGEASCDLCKAAQRVYTAEQRRKAREA